MNHYSFLPTAYAAAIEGEAPVETAAAATEGHTEVAAAEHVDGLSVQLSTVAFQALNFAILLVALHLILYKPLVKLLTERARKIKEGVENADKATVMLAEADTIRMDMIKDANMESQKMMEKTRKSSEEMKAAMMDQAHKEADSIIKSGQQLVEMQKAKTMEELKAQAVGMIMKTAEKVLREKLDPTKDKQFIEVALQ